MDGKLIPLKLKYRARKITGGHKSSSSNQTPKRKTPIQGNGVRRRAYNTHLETPWKRGKRVVKKHED